MRTLRAIALAASLVASAAWGQSLTLQVDSEELYANLPFILSLSATGFDETPQPEAPELAIANCQVTYLGVSPSVSQQIQIVNGQRSEWREVTFVYRWRVQAPSAGRYQVPPLTVSQGAKTATSRAAAFTTRPMEVTTDMIVRMNLPERPVWAGETFDVALEWLLTRDVERYEFVVPLFAADAVRVEAPPGGGGQTVAFPAGAGEVKLPMLRDSVTEGGERYTRLRFPARVTALAPGTLDIAPVRVAARLEAGSVRDAFGFRRTRTALFQAQGERRTLTVRPLPQTGRPPGFVNAVGRGFTLAVQASRSVVQVGDPIELAVTVRGDGDLEGLSLPPLSGPEALPAQLFSVPSALPFGVVDAAANAKTFDVTVRVMSAEAQEVPAINLPYFDPVAGEYAIAKSQPIALSVQTGAVIGAADVATATPAATAPATVPVAAPTGTATTAAGTGSLLGADMSLSDPAETLQVPWGTKLTPYWLGMLYLAPLLLVSLNFVWRRSASQRGRRRQVAQAQRELNAALKADAPAKEAAPRVSKALAALATALGMTPPRTDVMERLETTAFDPRAADQPLDADTIAAVQELAREWQAGNAALTSAVAALPLAVALLANSAAGQAIATGTEPQPTASTQLEAAQEIYRRALEEADRVRRTRLFAEAEQRLRPLAEAHPDAPDLLADWANAALGAGDAGRAALGWRRALAAQPSHERAARNLAWLRERGPSWLPHPATAGALDSLLAWRNSLSAPQWHWVAAIAFALAVVLLIPWSPRRIQLLRRLALVPIAGCAIALGTATLGDTTTNAAVVLSDGTTLRSADSHGAPPTLAYPLPAAAEVTVLERRDPWLRIALADGTRGWLPANAVALVRPETPIAG